MTSAGPYNDRELAGGARAITLSQPNVFPIHAHNAFDSDASRVSIGPFISIRCSGRRHFKPSSDLGVPARAPDDTTPSPVIPDHGGAYVLGLGLDGSGMSHPLDHRWSV